MTPIELTFVALGVIMTTITLAALRQRFSGHGIDVDAELDERGVQALRYDPFHVPNSEYDTEQAASALFDAIEEHQAAEFEADRQDAIDFVAATAAAVRRGEQPPIAHFPEPTAHFEEPSADEDPEEVLAAAVREAISAKLSAAPIAADDLKVVLNASAGASGMMTIPQMAPLFSWLQDKFGLTLAQFLDAAYIPPVHGFSSRPNDDLYNVEFVASRIQETIEELQKASGKRT